VFLIEEKRWLCLKEVGILDKRLVNCEGVKLPGDNVLLEFAHGTLKKTSV
jgi:hypothetical protein